MLNRLPPSIHLPLLILDGSKCICICICICIGIPQGCVYHFKRNSKGAWNEESILFGENTASGDAFGYAMALSGTLLVVSAPLFDSAWGIDTGKQPPLPS